VISGAEEGANVDGWAGRDEWGLSDYVEESLPRRHRELATES